MFDVWHVAKSVLKKLVAASKLKDCQLLSEWKQSIVNHVYWCATGVVDDSGDMKLAKWLSIENHVMNEHTGHGKLFPSCLHGPHTEKRKWILPHTKAASKLSSIINAKALCKDVKRLSPVYQTYCLEAFHSLIIQFAPKSIAYSYMGMKCRLLLAALHYNENSSRGSKRNLDGSEKCVVTFPKAKQGKYAVRLLRESSSFTYVIQIMTTVLELYRSENKAVAAKVVSHIPPAVCSAYVHPDKKAALMHHKSRFADTAHTTVNSGDDVINDNARVENSYSDNVNDSDDTIIYDLSHY